MSDTVIVDLPAKVWLEYGRLDRVTKDGHPATHYIYTQHKTQDCPGIRKGTEIEEVVADGCQGDLFCSVGCLDEHYQPAKPSLPRVAGDPDFDPPEGGEGKQTKPNAIPEGKDYTREDIVDLVKELDRKFTDSDMDRGLITFATEWAKTYTGDFSYMVDMSAAAQKRKLSTGMARGVLNCFRNEVGREAPKQQGSGDKTLDLSSIPSGRYAVPGGDSRLKLQIDNVDKGKWKGWVFVKDGAEYGQQKRYGKQAPNSIYVGEIQEELATILANPAAAMAEYGHLTSTCGRCGRKLEDKESVARGIGPICAKEMEA